MAMSWHTMLEFEPPQVGRVVSDRNFSFEALTPTKECVINIPTVELAAAVVVRERSGKTVDKFAAFGLDGDSGIAGIGTADRRVLREP